MPEFRDSDTAALLERVRNLWESMVLTSTLPLNDRDNSRAQFDAALDSLTAYVRELEKMTVDPDISACLAALERETDRADAEADRALDLARLSEEQLARAQKAEAVVEAARRIVEIAPNDLKSNLARVALTAYDDEQEQA